ncbi:MAG: chloride channel protein [Cryobacterium sp.]|nr:chloride channel protein [Oligoflexia bacterium]
MAPHPPPLRVRERSVLLALVAGLFGGALSSLLLVSLDLATHLQTKNPSLLYFLPVAGLFIGGLYQQFGGRSVKGTNLVVEEIHRPTERTPGRMVPLVYATSILSHLFGASVGREGVAVQMSAGLADQLSRFFRISKEERTTLLQAGSAAGFAGALGTPFAGFVFGLEVLRPELPFKFERALECAIAAFVAIGVTHFFGIHHTRYGVLPSGLPLFSLHLGFAALVLGAATGLMVRIFIATTEALSLLSKSLFHSFGARAFCGGCLIIGTTFLVGNHDSIGLGIPKIQSSFIAASSASLPFEKLLFTALSIGFGFKGGEFIPLVFIGATLGSSLALLLQVPIAFAAACGVTSAFGSAARVPFALSLFAGEHFYPGFIIYALAANFAARWVVGSTATIFPSQHLLRITSFAP